LRTRTATPPAITPLEPLGPARLAAMGPATAQPWRGVGPRVPAATGRTCGGPAGLGAWKAKPGQRPGRGGSRPRVDSKPPAGSGSGDWTIQGQRAATFFAEGGSRAPTPRPASGLPSRFAQRGDVPTRAPGTDHFVFPCRAPAPTGDRSAGGTPLAPEHRFRTALVPARLEGPHGLRGLPRVGVETLRPLVPDSKSGAGPPGRPDQTGDSVAQGVGPRPWRGQHGWPGRFSGLLCPPTRPWRPAVVRHTNHPSGGTGPGWDDEGGPGPAEV